MNKALIRFLRKWDPEDINLCEELAKENEKITGHHGFWCTGGVGEDNSSPFVYKFEGEHPEESKNIKFNKEK